MTTFLLFFTAGLFLICFLISVHELGHLLAAKACGVQVLEFSVGLGRPLLSRSFGETEYKLRLIPLGGFVRILDKPPEDHKEKKLLLGRSFDEQPKRKRFLIILAGPLINLLFAMAILPIVFMVGLAVPVSQAQPACVASMHWESPLAPLGVRIGDCIVAVNKKSVFSWGEASLILSVDGAETLTLDRQGEKIEVSGPIPRGRLTAFGVNPEQPILIGHVVPGSPAHEAGLVRGDKIVMVDGVKADWDVLRSQFRRQDGKPSHLVISRSGETSTMLITPVQQDGKWLFGLVPQRGFTMVSFDFFKSVSLGYDKFFAMLYSTVGLTQQHYHPPSDPPPKVSSENIGGPLALIEFAGKAAQMGVGMFISITAFLSIQFALLNLLPIPIFDGGQLLLLGYEAVTSKPPSQKLRLALQRVGVVIVTILVMVAMVNDFMRLAG